MTSLYLPQWSTLRNPFKEMYLLQWRYKYSKARHCASLSRSNMMIGLQILGRSSVLIIFPDLRHVELIYDIIYA